jgi:hypothetical protein
LCVGCDKRVLRYDDDLDLPAIGASFKCGDKPTSGDRAQACRILTDFESASPFLEWPSKGVDTWFGRKVCSDSIDNAERVDFGLVYLKPGLGKTTFPDDVKVDTARDLPTGAQFIASSAGKMSPEMRRGYITAIDAAEKGVTPVFAGVSDLDRGSLESFWERTKKGNGTADFFRLVQSKGPSVLGGALTKEGTAKTPSATYFIRAVGLRMIVVYPSWAEYPTPCVAELWKIHSSP